MTGQSIAHYHVTAKLGQGGMGAVYRATDTKLDREVAIKVLPTEYAADAGRLKRFEREARRLAALTHPNIMVIHEVAHAAYALTRIAGVELSCQWRIGAVPAG